MKVIKSNKVAGVVESVFGLAMVLLFGLGLRDQFAGFETSQEAEVVMSSSVGDPQIFSIGLLVILAIAAGLVLIMYFGRHES